MMKRLMSDFKFDWLTAVLVIVMIIGAVGLVLTPSNWGTP